MKIETATSDTPNDHRYQKLSKERKTNMNPKRLITTLIGITCLLSMFCIYAISQENSGQQENRGQQEYRGQSFPNDELIAALPWMNPQHNRPARILGKQKISNDQYRLYYSDRDGYVGTITVIKLDTGLWYYCSDAGNDAGKLRQGIFMDLKK